MKTYIGNRILSIALPAWVGTGEDQGLATRAIHGIHVGLIYKGHSVRNVAVDDGWVAMSKISESLCNPMEMKVLIHIEFGGAVTQEMVTDTIDIATEVVMWWSLDVPLGVWSRVKSPEVEVWDEEMISLDEILEILD
jgi:hypothetical protein